jgi:hypothetical protein
LGACYCRHREAELLVISERKSNSDELLILDGRKLKPAKKSTRP